MNAFVNFVDRLEERYAGSFGLTIVFGSFVAVTAPFTGEFFIISRAALLVLIAHDVWVHQTGWQIASFEIDRYCDEQLAIEEANLRLHEVAVDVDEADIWFDDEVKRQAA